MEAHKTFWNRIVTVVGLLCLGMALAILPLGVSAVRAGDGAGALISVDPLLVADQQEAAHSKPAVAPVLAPVDVEEIIRPGRGGVEVQPGIIVLNTRGYNYGPPPAAIDPAAMKLESETP